MNIVVTVAAATPEEALSSIAALPQGYDAVEVRVERFAAYQPASFRAATGALLILTRRGRTISPSEVKEALAAGFDLVDVEYGTGLEWLEPFHDRVILSHHDYQGMPDPAPLLRDMRRLGCRHVKLAVVPETLRDNFTLLDQQAPGTTLMGMGERGLFSRLLAPFLGSQFTFVSPSDVEAAAPGQISLQRALQIYGQKSDRRPGEVVFAVAGDPAGHSLSPSIHNPLFRARGVPAAYSIASVASFGEVEEALLDGRLRGVSVTAPFKEEAFRFAEARGAGMGDNARQSGVVNTLVMTSGGLLADNTDVDGFTSLLARLCGRERKTAAVIGAGGTARAALMALDRAGMKAIVYNRTESRGRAVVGKWGAQYEPLASLPRFDGEIVIDTVTGGVELDLPLRPGMTVIEAGYGYHPRVRPAGVEWIGGEELLRAQAVRQHELFMKVFDEP